MVNSLYPMSFSLPLILVVPVSFSFSLPLTFYCSTGLLAVGHLGLVHTSYISHEVQYPTVLLIKPTVSIDGIFWILSIVLLALAVAVNISVSYLKICYNSCFDHLFFGFCHDLPPIKLLNYLG